MLGMRCFITICVRLTVHMCIYKPLRCPRQVWANPRLISREEKTFGEDAHTFGSSPAQQNLPRKLNGVFVLACCSVHSILAPVNLLSCLICAPQRWLIHSPSRRRTTLVAGGSAWRGVQRKLRPPLADLFPMNNLTHAVVAWVKT